MDNPRLLIWCNFNFDEPGRAALTAGVAGAARIVFARRGEPAEATRGLLDAQIAFGQPDVATLIASERIRWVHVSTAGYTRYDRQDLRDALRARGAVVTNSSSVYADPCAEHILGFMLAMARQLPQAIALQRESTWDFQLLRPRVRILENDTVLIVGYGAIGARLAELLEPFGVEMTGIRRVPRGDERIPVLPMEQLDDQLARADHVVDLLPNAKAIARIFNADRFARMKDGARFYNVGRGDTVDQAALRQALESGHLASACLDVTTPEPLPPDDPLWTAPNCWVTPHIAGGAQDEQLRLVRHFLANFTRFSRGEPMRNRVLEVRE